MSDTKWGFEKDYAHRHLPNKWQQTSGFTHFPADPLSKKSHRHRDVPVYREDSVLRALSYTERTQDKRWNMSSYGVHREMPWEGSLRSPRNPFPGLPTRETRYSGQPPSSTYRSTRSVAASMMSARGGSLHRGENLGAPPLSELRRAPPVAGEGMWKSDVVPDLDLESVDIPPSRDSESRDASILSGRSLDIPAATPRIYSTPRVV